MQRKLVFFIFSSLLLFSQCNNEKKNTTTTTPPSVSVTPKGFYKHLKGTIDSFAITMDLVQIHSSSSDNMPYNFRGHYYYDKYQQPIALYGELDSTGNITLHEANWQGKELFFTGKLDTTGSFSGTWHDATRKTKRAFSLKETYTDGAVAFDFTTFEDSVKGWKNAAQSPIGTFDMQVLLPAKNVESSISSFLKDKIFMGVNNDSLEKSYANLSLDALKNAQRDTFFKNYVAAMTEEKPEPNGEAAAMLNHAESSSVAVLFNEKGLLSLGYGTYSYSGGAHGNHGTRVASYNLAQKKVMKLTDVFLPKYEKTLNAALTNAVRRQFNMKPKEPLSSHLFENTIKPTTNFCITRKGILFLYNPYEIGAYALGEIELFIPFEEIKSIVKL